MFGIFLKIIHLSEYIRNIKTNIAWNPEDMSSQSLETFAKFEKTVVFKNDKVRTELNVCSQNLNFDKI